MTTLVTLISYRDVLCRTAVANPIDADAFREAVANVPGLHVEVTSLDTPRYMQKLIEGCSDAPVKQT